MVVADVSRGAVMLVILFQPTLGTIYVVAALHSVITAFFAPARAAALPLVVESEELVEANSTIQWASSLVLVAGPVISAQMMLTLGLAPTVAVDVASFLISALLLSRLRVRSAQGAEERAPRASMGSEIRDGWAYLTRHGLVLHLTILLFMALVCTGVWIPLAPGFIEGRLGRGEHLLGQQLAVFGWGTVVGGLVAPYIVARFGKGVTLFGGLVAEALSLTAYALSPTFGISMAVLFAWGVFVSIIVVPFYALLQFLVDERFLGRVFAVVKQSEDGALVLSMVAVILIQAFVNDQVILLLTGLTYLSVAFLSVFTRNGRTLLTTR